jgi:hypothetical protein
VYLLRAPLDPGRPVVVLRVAVEVLFSIILLGLSIAICGRLRRKKAVHVEVCLLGLGGVHTAAFAAHYHQMLQLDPGAALSIDDVCSVILHDVLHRTKQQRDARTLLVSTIQKHPFDLNNAS